MRRGRPWGQARLPADVAAHEAAGVAALDLPLGDVARLVHNLAHLHVSGQHRHGPGHGRPLVGRPLGAEEGHVDGTEHLIAVEIGKLGVYHVQRVVFFIQLPNLKAQKIS